MKRIFSVLVSAALVLSALGSVQARPGKGTVQPGARPGGVIDFVPRTIEEANTELGYTIKARYPEAVGAGGDPRLEKLNHQLKELVMKEVSDFKKNYQELEESLSAVGGYYESEYRVELVTDDLVSINFGGSTYYEGAEHPNYSTHTFNYDLNSGRVLKFSDIFKPDSDYLSVLSDYAIEDLKRQLGDEADGIMSEDGAGASLENYQRWTITPAGVKVTFDPFQVAPYSQSPYDVVIPYTVLKDVINRAGPLAEVDGKL